MRCRTCLYLGSIGLVGMAACMWVARAGNTVSPADQRTTTLLLGLKSCQQKVRTIHGIATAEVVYEPEKLARMTAQDAQAGAPKDLQYDRKGLHTVAFWVNLEEQRWRIEVAELMTTGLNEWGFLTNYAMGQERPRAPVLLEVCDGSSITWWDMLFGRAEVSQYDARLSHGGGYACGKLCRLLMLGWSAVDPEGYSLVGRETVGEVDCYKLVDRTETDTIKSKVCLWVAPEYGFALVRYMTLGASKKEPRAGGRTEATATSLAEAPGGIWIPTEVMVTQYTYRGGEEKPLCTFEALHVDELTVNEQLSQWLFHLQLPLGTIVQQEGQGTILGHPQASLAYFTEHPTVPRYNQAYMAPLTEEEFGPAQ